MEIVIFGAGSTGTKVYQTLCSMGIECVYFIDNSKKKWGTYIDNVEIKSPDSIRQNSYDIIIASVFYEEIEKQLYKMGIDLKRIKTKESYIKEVLDKKMAVYKEQLVELALKSTEKSVLIDLDHGLLMGGVESWSMLVARGCLKRGINTVIYTDLKEKKLPHDLKRSVRHKDVSRKRYEEEIISSAEDMITMLPFTFLANWMEQSFWAAYILKKLYPEDVNIVGIVHHDMKGYYIRNQFLQNSIDTFLCVSTDTYRKMILEYGIFEKKVQYKPVPIETGKYAKEEKEIVTVGVGSRLEKAMKRVDLLVPLLQKLESMGTEYRFMIAGDGGYYETLKTFLTDNKLTDKVHMLGELEIESMPAFWNSVDIVVSTSDSEGMGLSILEGMGAGCVPVATDTAGIREFVKNGENGYVVKINDIETMAKHINYLSENHELVREMGQKAAEMIKAKCSLREYIQYIKNL